MVGFLGSDQGTLFEFWPFFGTEEGIPRYTQLRTKIVLPERWWGEFGFGISGTTIWFMWYLSSYPISYGRIWSQLKNIKKEVREWREQNR